MKKLNIEPYIHMFEDREMDKETGKIKIVKRPVEIDPREKANVLLMNGQRKLNGSEAYKAGAIAGKFLMAPSKTILLEDDEYKELKEALEQVKGLSLEEYPFLCKVFDAVDVEVKEAGKKKDRKKG